ncbi:hypothetical protein [Catellatospora sp. NPDC049609]|uniref:hypothetical protein n=1 Tax=Catellatospora sp. NPDC049609 TaxID=3155505 RepID=UPI003437D67C
MTTRSPLTHLLTGALLGGLLLTGCAPTEEPEVGSSVTPQPSTPGASPSDFLPPSPTAKPRPGTSGPIVPPPAKDGTVITATGTVERIDLEGGCTVLRTAGVTYQLLGGDPAQLKPGTKVTVKGRTRPDMMTVCQVGPVLEVLSASPAS